MKNLYTVIIRYKNGSISEHHFPNFTDVRDFYRNKISYTGNVSRVEVKDHYGSVRSIWSAAWDDASKYAGLSA